MSKINIAIAGVGNCASALLQGIEMYKQSPENTIGLISYEPWRLHPRRCERGGRL